MPPIDIAVEGLAARILFGTGSPVTVYAADAAMGGVAYIQTDAKPGARLWLCHNGSGAYAWENLRPYVAAIATAAITATLTTVATTYTGSVASAQAVVGMTARMEPIGDPGSVLLTAWVATPGQINYRITNLSAVNVSLTNATFALYLSSPA